MQPPQQSRSEIEDFILGIENVHCVLENSASAREFYSKIFGPPRHEDGTWSEFKIAGFDFAVDRGKARKFVITFKTNRLDALRSFLEKKLSTRLEILNGDYGRYIEICPPDGFCIHFFESNKNPASNI